MDLGPATAENAAASPSADLEGKSFGPRALSYILDLVVVNLANLTVGVVGGAFFGIVLYILAALVGYEPLVGTPPTTINFAVGILISFVYFIAFESLCGATPGKVILRMRVAKLDGDRPPLYTATVRALWRLLDGLFFGLVAASSMKPPLRQRYGDKHAKTIVLASDSPTLRYKLSVPLFFLAALLYIATSLLLQIASVLAYTTYYPTS